MRFIDNLFVEMLHFLVRVKFIHATEATTVFFITQVIQMLTLDLNEKFGSLELPLELVKKHVHLIFVVLKSSYKHLLFLVMPLLQVFLHHLLESFV
jgi:hypothetical protein